MKSMVIDSNYSKVISLGIKKNIFLKNIKNLKAGDIILFKENNKLVGQAKIKNIHYQTIDSLWYHFGFEGMTPQADFDTYFKNKDKGYCIELSSQKLIG